MSKIKPPVTPPNAGKQPKAKYEVLPLLPDKPRPVKARKGEKMPVARGNRPDPRMSKA